MAGEMERKQIPRQPCPSGSRDDGRDDIKHLLWLREKIGNDLLDAPVIHTGPQAHRRQDGIAVVPAALLGA